MRPAAKRFLLACGCMVVVLFVAQGLALAQSPAPLPQPDLPLRANGSVFAITAQADGGIVFGGEFSEVNGVARANLARLKPDGTLDLDWNAGTNGPVYALAASGTGAVYVGGLFNEAGGQQRLCLAKFSGTGMGALDPDWAPSQDFYVRSLAVDADGSVYVGGYFHFMGGLPRNRIAKLSGTGQGDADPAWDPSASGSVQTIVPDGSGAVYVGGAFSSIGGQTRTGIARLSATGTGAVDAAWNPQANDAVISIALDGSSVYAGGFFTTIGGQARARVARLSTSGAGAADATWNPSADDALNTLFVAGDAVYAGGFFDSIGGHPRRHVARLFANGTGEADPAWDASADGRVWSVLGGSAGSVYVGGSFSQIGGQTHRGFAPIDAGASPTGTFDATEPGRAFALARLSDGRVVVGGTFFAAGDQARANILRLLPNGMLDPAWNPGVVNGSDSFAVGVSALAVDADDTLFLAGIFDHVDGIARASIAKFAAQGSSAIDPTWDPSCDGNMVWTLALDGKGSIYAGGDFFAIGGEARNYIAKLSVAGEGAADPTWDPSADYVVNVVKVDTSGSVYAGGSFTSIGGLSRNFIAKLAADDGTADPDWDANADSAVYALEPDHQGSIFAGGYFSNIGGASRAGIAKLSTSGSGAADPAWNPSTSPLGAVVTSMALDGNGALFVGGTFYELGGELRDSIAKLSTTGNGSPDPGWNPGVDDGYDGSEGLLTLLAGNGVVYAGGGFSHIGGEVRVGLAALPAVGQSDVIFADGFDAPP